MRSCAFLIFEAATISIALVIFFVPSTLLILTRISLPAAMRGSSFQASVVVRSGERLLERGDCARRAPSRRPCRARLVSSIFARRPAWLVFRCVCRPLSKASTLLTSTASMKPLLTANSDAAISEIGSGEYCGCLNSSVTRAPRSSCFLVASSRSDPNWAKAASSRNCARSLLMPPDGLLDRPWSARPSRPATPRCRR